MKIYVYPTDSEWFDYLSDRPHTDEVNFWRPGGKQAFTQLAPGELLLFKRKGKLNRIAGGGVFLQFGMQSIADAWKAFGDKNGRPDFQQFRVALAKHGEDDPDRPIGCVVLINPVFLPREDWIETPADFPMSSPQGTAYDATKGTGRRLYEWASTVLFSASARRVAEAPETSEYAPTLGAMWSEPVLARRRLGQGGFKVVVSEIYQRRCAISGERTMPVLEAAHIRPVSEGGQHMLPNGLLLRVDIHTLFDAGYIGITPDYRVRVSRHLKGNWSNGRIYYAHDGQELRLPHAAAARPSKELLEWHSDTVFKS